MGWTETTPQNPGTVTAQWPVSFDATLTGQKIQYYADEYCVSASGSPVDLNSATAMTDNTAGNAGQFLSYRTISVLSSGTNAWSQCSSEMGTRSIWSYLGGYSNNPHVSYFTLDSSGYPVGIQSLTTTTSQISRWNGSAWTAISSQISSNSIALALDSSNNPYIAYSDSSQSGKLTVAKWNGSAWAVIGSAGISVGQAFGPAIALDSSNNPYVHYGDQGLGYLGTVMHWNGTSWQNVGPANYSSGSDGGGGAQSMVLDSSGNPYVTFSDQNNSEYATIMHWNGSSWVTVGSAGIGSNTAFGLSIVLDSSNNPYITFISGFATGSQQWAVMHWNGSAWSSVGTGDYSQEISMTLDSSGTPWIAYNNASIVGAVDVARWNGSAWVGVGPADFRGSGISQILVNSSGSAFITTGGYLRRYDQ